MKDAYGELWKLIPNTPYEISNQRRIRRHYEYRGKKYEPHFTYLKEKNNIVNLRGKKHNVDKLMMEIWGVEVLQDVDGERWKDIKGCDGNYQISSQGRVRSKGRYIECKNGRRFYKKPQIIKPTVINSGYEIINLHLKSGDLYHKLVHRLVAEHFIPNPKNLEQVNHKDEDKTNNVVDNLEWCTREYNSVYGTNQERRIATRLKNNKGVYSVKLKEIGSWIMDGRQ